uniref:Capsid protein n=1 Tax=Torque teno canis virus TaxID=687385 RepID=A0A286M9P9_9VIRU|nr:ORF1 [Torque teno canis virus]
MRFRYRKWRRPRRLFRSRRRRGYARRRWRRRAWGRRRRVRRYRRRRGGTKRQYISSIMQWNPQHRHLCYIKGITWLCAARADRMSWPGIKQIAATDSTRYWSTILVGGCGVLTLSMDWFFFENLRWRNRWSHSNVGYDLARYMGTHLYFPPLADIWYIVWTDTEFVDQPKKVMSYTHPWILLMTKKHKVIKPRKWNGKGKKIFLKPPAVFNSAWYTSDKWCGAGLGRIYFSFLNPFKQIMHTGQTEQSFPFAIELGNTDYDKPPNINYDFQNTTFVKQVWAKKDKKYYYRADWDTGDGNAIMLPNTLSPTTPASWLLLEWDAPYWLWFWGKTYQDFVSSHTPEGNQYYGQIYVKWWPITNPYDQGPHTYQEDKEWCLMMLEPQPNFMTCNSIAAALKIAQFGPCVYSATDLQPSQIPINIPMYYLSKWQWGGSTQGTSTHIDNPCNPRPRSIQIADPSHAPRDVIHPWDVDASGTISTAKLKQLMEGLGYREPKPKPGPPETLIPPGAPTPELDYYSSETESDDFDTGDSEEEEEDHQDPRWVRESIDKLTRRIRGERRQRQQLGNGLLALLKEKK